MKGAQYYHRMTMGRGRKDPLWIRSGIHVVHRSGYKSQGDTNTECELWMMEPDWSKIHSEGEWKHARQCWSSWRTNLSVDIETMRFQEPRGKWQDKIYGKAKKAIANACYREAWNRRRLAVDERYKPKTSTVFIRASQKLRMNLFKTMMVKTQWGRKHRMCGKRSERISHIFNECSKLVPEEYKYRYDHAGRMMHWNFKLLDFK